MDSDFMKSDLFNFSTHQNFANHAFSIQPIVEVLQRFEEVISLGGYLINIIDFRNFSYPYLSPNSKEILGYEREQIIQGGLLWLEQFVEPNDLLLFQKNGIEVIQFATSLSTERRARCSYNHSFRFKHGKKKEYVWLYQQNHFSGFDSNNALIYSMGLITDISHLMPSHSKRSWSIVERLDDGVIQYIAGSSKTKSATPVVSLTLREVEIISLSAQGFSSERTSSKLGISKHTVLAHKKNILKKTKSKNMPEAITFAINLGYL